MSGWIAANVKFEKRSNLARWHFAVVMRPLDVPVAAGSTVPAVLGVCLSGSKIPVLARSALEQPLEQQMEVLHRNLFDKADPSSFVSQAAEARGFEDWRFRKHSRAADNPSNTFALYAVGKRLMQKRFSAAHRYGRRAVDSRRF